MNRLLTFRMDEVWRKKAAKICLRDNPSHIVDICTGTGDLACHLARYKPNDVKITALDFSEPMLEVARKKFSRRKLTGVESVFGDVSELPFPTGTIDIICIGFGFRNLTYKNVKSDVYLSEIFRVMKQGGKFVIIETSQPKNNIIKALYHLYLSLFVKYIGGLLSGNKKAYHYLSHSAIHYYTPDELKKLLENKGFKSFNHNRLFFGIAALTVVSK